MDTGGADPNVTAKTGSTALHHAVSSGSPELVGYLLEHGANVDANSDMGTPLLSAVFYNRMGALTVLLAHSANVNTSVGKTPPPLCAAAGMGNVGMVAALLEAGFSN